jgi:hypothetical protein
MSTVRILIISPREPSDNYLFAGAMDGGTQVISFILNFAVFGAAGTAHAFPDWWGNDSKYSADRCMMPPG